MNCVIHNAVYNAFFLGGGGMVLVHVFTKMFGCVYIEIVHVCDICMCG